MSKNQPKASSKHPLITVIIPVYNTARTLPRCLDSVRANTYKNLEIILVDDGSTDKSGELCDQLAKNDSRIKVLHQKNAGLSAARNHSLRLMQGQYVTFVDSDDAISPNLIEYLYSALTKTHTKMSISSFSRVFPDGRRESFLPRHLQSSTLDSTTPSPLVFDTATCLIAMLCENGFTMSAWAKLYDRSLFKRLQFPEGKLYEDVGTTYRLVLQCPNIAFVPLELYDYYQTPDSIIHRPFTFAKLDLIQLTDQMCNDITSAFATPSYQAQSPSSHSSGQPSPLPHPLFNALRCRRMHARFSILRQMVLFNDFDRLSPAETAQFHKTQSQIITYLKSHQADVLKNPVATTRDRLAMRALNLGLPVFKLAWKIYNRH